MIEPMQGEGGVNVAPPEFLQALRELCDRHGLLLVLDEVQSGMGRTGKLFAHEWAGITPDIMAVAKGIGGGFPLGALLATEEAAKGMTAGTHGSTFGGNPLAMAVGNAVLDVVLEPGFLEACSSKALRLKQALAAVQGPASRSRRGGARPGPADGPQAQGRRRPTSSRRRSPRSCCSPAPATTSCACCRRSTSTDEEIAEAPSGCRARFDRVVEARELESLFSSAGRSAMAPKSRPLRSRGIFSISTRSTPRRCARIIDMAHAMKRAGKRVPAKLRAARHRRRRAGHDLREAVDAHARVVRRRHAPARRADACRSTTPICSSAAARSIADTARVLSRYVDAIMIRANAHDDAARAGALRDDAGHQRPDRQEPPLPGHGRHHDVRGAQGADQGPHRRLGRRRQQRRRVVDARRRALRLRAARRLPRRAASRAGGDRLGEAREGRRRRSASDAGEGRARRRLRRHRHLGVDGPDGCRAAQEDARALSASTPS